MRARATWRQTDVSNALAVFGDEFRAQGIRHNFVNSSDS